MKLKQKTNKSRYIPSPFTILFIIMLIFIMASWIGKIFNDQIKSVGILDIFPAVWRGFSEKSEVILFIFAIGGAFGVMMKLKAIDAGIKALVTKLKGKEWILISSLTIIFGLNGTAYGLWEETIIFFPVLIPIFIKAKYGAFTAVAIILIGCGTGVLSSTINPFAVGTAVEAINNVEGFKDFSLGIGQGMRWLNFIFFQIIAVIIVLKLASFNKKRLGVVKGVNNQEIINTFQNEENIKFTLKRKIALILFTLAFIVMIIGLLPWNSFLDLKRVNFWDKYLWWFASTNGTWEKFGSWTFISSAAIFLMITIIIFAICFNDFQDKKNGREETFIGSFKDGIKDMVSVALIISVASGLGIILNQTGFGKLIASSISGVASSNLIFWGISVFIISLFLAFLIPSTSGFSSAFIGIFATAISISTPVDKQNGALVLTILAFILASGIVNLCSPTSAALMAYTNYSKIPYVVWLKQTYWINLSYFVLSILVLTAIASLINAGILF